MKPERITELRRKAVSGHCDYQYGRAVLIECLDDIERLMEGERAADKEIERLRAENEGLHETLDLMDKPHSELCLELNTLAAGLRKIKTRATNTEGQDNA